jgi:hypothetical protein
MNKSRLSPKLRVGTNKISIELTNSLFFFICFSEKRPARSELIVLVAHNDDPTGKVCFLFY